MHDLTTLPNIGEKLAAKLETGGVTSRKELSDLGSVAAVLRITGGEPLTGYNMLYAIEGAIRGVRWHSIPKEDLRSLRAQYDRKQAAG